MEELARTLGALVKDIGFPAFVAGWLLVKIGPALDNLTKAISELREINQIAAGLNRRASDPKP